ncbi:hypothetical protein BBW65_04790 [Helicobacter enhydrae]|uniref:Uncharacterized protein n=1 Tax=Helicobacter enhydrae TaxID=222136 RepID=A0A1B1U5Y1_9HELI|nr:hypothetical protein BBW65_04790 [Helicobacter enhydrae]
MNFLLKLVCGATLFSDSRFSWRFLFDSWFGKGVAFGDSRISWDSLSLGWLEQTTLYTILESPRISLKGGKGNL